MNWLLLKLASSDTLRLPAPESEVRLSPTSMLSLSDPLTLSGLLMLLSEAVPSERFPLSSDTKCFLLVPKIDSDYSYSGPKGFFKHNFFKSNHLKMMGTCFDKFCLCNSVANRQNSFQLFVVKNRLWAFLDSYHCLFWAKLPYDYCPELDKKASRKIPPKN